MITIFTFIFGAMIGSFLNVLIYRLPLSLNWVNKRSFCPKCKVKIPFYQNIPIVSYAIQLGRCRACSEKISPQYLFIELLTAVVAVFFLPPKYTNSSLFEYFFFFSIFCVFLVHFLIDLKHQILPDELNIYLALLFLFYGFFKLPLLHVIIGGAFGFGFPYLVAYVFYKWKGIEGLGGGDIKLFGALGLYLGPMGIMQNIFLSCLVGSIVGVLLIGLKVIDRTKPIPFGPFIIIAASFQIFFPSFLVDLNRWFLF